MHVCVLGATGLVGKETLALVHKAWPAASLGLFASRDQTLVMNGEQLSVQAAAALENASAQRGDLAFVALDDDHSRRYVPRLLELGYRVIDKSNAYRADPNVPLVVAGVNAGLVNESVRLIANPNCTTIPLMLALGPLQRRFGLANVTVSTYQAVSGGGAAMLDAFWAATKRGFASETAQLGSQLEAHGYAGNTVPHSGGTDDTGFSSEERKLVVESRKILDLPELVISAQCCRVGVAVGHYENVWVTFDKALLLEDIASMLADPAQAPFLRFLPGAAGEGLSAVSCVGDRDRALVGRLRLDPRDAGGRSVCLTVVADNLRLGAATNAVRVASRWFPSAVAELQA